MEQTTKKVKKTRSLRLLLLLLAMLLCCTACVGCSNEEELPYEVVTYNDGTVTFVFSDWADFQNFYTDFKKTNNEHLWGVDVSKVNSELQEIWYINDGTEYPPYAPKILNYIFHVNRNEKSFKCTLRFSDMQGAFDVTEESMGNLVVEYCGNTGEGRYFRICIENDTYQAIGFITISDHHLPDEDCYAYCEELIDAIFLMS
jgi:hypothetical protein